MKKMMYVVGIATIVGGLAGLLAGAHYYRNNLLIIVAAITTFVGILLTMALTLEKDN